MFERDWFKDKTIIGPDWPLSLGWKIMFSTTNTHFVDKKFVVKKEEMEDALDNNATCEGMYAGWTDSKMRMIAINYNENNMVRFTELVVHEVSHLVDHVLADACIVKIDTELRAYLNDWVVGKILSKIDYSTKNKA